MEDRISKVSKKILDLIPFEDKKICLYGNGYYGRCLSYILKAANIEHNIADDIGEENGIYRLDEIVNKKDTLLILCVYDNKTREKMEQKASELGFNAIKNNSSLFAAIDSLSQDIGYLKAKNDNILPNGCPVCDGDAVEIYINHKNFSIRKCANCGHAFVSNIRKEDVDSFYDDIGYFEQNYKVNIDDFFNEHLYGFAKTRTQMISPFLDIDIEKTEPLNFLELGCLDGRTLWYLKQFGHNVFGCEVNKHVAAVGIEKLEIDIRCNDIHECGFENNFFDVIFSSHVMEHLIDPFEVMRASYRLLKSGGLFIANLPCNEIDYENFHHLHFFSDKSILNAMNSIFDEIIHSDGGQYMANDKLFDTITVCGKKKLDQG